jgi:hypothetical protein
MRASQVYIFKCRGTELFALSIDETGCNLPKGQSRDWMLLGDTTTSAVKKMLSHAVDEIADRGFCLFTQDLSDKFTLH